MKVFIAGKLGAEHEVRRAMAMVRDAGHEITFDWTTIPHLKPFEENEDASREAAILEAQGVAESEALILLAHENGRGMYVELGMALASKKPVVVVGGGSATTMFFYHPLVHRVNTVSEALDLLSGLGPSVSRSR